MFTLSTLVFTLLSVSQLLLATPLPVDLEDRGHPKPCYLPKKYCPRQGATALNVVTPFGLARGAVDPAGANRFAVRYATAKRWAASTIANQWELPNGSNDVTALPLTCPQPDADPSTFSEDCLSMVLYVPKNVKIGSNVPIMVWIHGGSYIVGSASDPAINGAKLATATNAIIAVVQYRLGALGFMTPNGGTNLGIKDIVTAMNFLKVVAPAFGGNGGKITIAGQSSGADMVRALLAAPSASGLFQSGIIQSDPMDQGFISKSVQQKLQTYYNTKIGCAATNTQCQNALSLDAIINAQSDLFSNAVTVDASAGVSIPIRAVRDGSFITSPLDSTASFPKQSKPLLISTVKNEAGFNIFAAFPDPVPSNQFDDIVNETFGSPRTQKITTSSFYAGGGSPSLSPDDARPTLEVMGTDYLFKCSSWTFARAWAKNGGKAFVGTYVVGATHDPNEYVDFCTTNGAVCHQDDIEIVFGTVSNPTSAQSALVTEMQKRYASFLTSGNPNPSGLTQWKSVAGDTVHALLLGGTGETPIGSCDPSFWGAAVPYDYQVFGI